MQVQELFGCFEQFDPGKTCSLAADACTEAEEADLQKLCRIDPDSNNLELVWQAKVFGFV